MNPILYIDGYKLDHRRQYPAKTTAVYSNWTPRESRVPDQNEVIFFGLQAFIQQYIENEMNFGFFDQPVEVVCKKYADRVNGYLGPNSIGTDHIRALHELGYMPLRFCAVPEGTAVPLRVPMFTVENTHPDFFWLVNYFESLLSAQVWGPCTSATQAWRLRKLLNAAAARTGTDPAFVQWQGHDFSFRGMFGVEAAAMSGAGHLLSFAGTDTLPAMDWIDMYYGDGMPENYLLGGSVAATEHSVMCAGGSGEGDELKTFERILDLYPTGVVSVVSDTWNLWTVLTETLPKLKDKIMARDGKLVIRPDSGDPANIICGDPDADRVQSPVGKGVVKLLDELFGHTVTSTGHKLLDSHIGCIYGDSINYARAKDITDRLAAAGYASGNIVFGVGSYTYQYVTRDTFGFAMKATWAEIDGEGKDLYKQPVTGDGMKTSAKGRLAVMPTMTLVNQATPEQEDTSMLQLVWQDGTFHQYESFDKIRARVNA